MLRWDSCFPFKLYIYILQTAPEKYFVPPFIFFFYRFIQVGEEISFYPLYHTTYETFYAVSELMDPGFVVSVVFHNAYLSCLVK